MATPLSRQQAPILRQRYRQQTIGALLGVALLAVGGWFFFGKSLGLQGDAESNIAGLWQFESGDGSAGAREGPDGAFDATYENHAYGFSFEHPSAMTIGELEESGGYVVLAELGEENKSFQIFVLPWDEGEGVLTPERVRRDLPDIVIENPQVATLPAGRQALIFESKEGDMATREVWLVHGGYLYQVTAPLASDATLAGIMATWEFE